MQLARDDSQDELRALLQQRLAQFGLLLALIFGLFYSWRIANTVLANDGVSRDYLPWQSISIAAFASLWLLCRGKPRSYLLLRAAEVATLVAAAAGAILMCLHITYTARPDSILLLCLTYTLIVRAIMIPSSPQRTLAYGLLFAAPFLLSVYMIHSTHHDPGIYTAAADPRLRTDAATLARRWTVVGGMWWIAALVISTATSSVIYGLRRLVRDARRLGQYTLTEKLGQGGMGVVYRAQHALLRRPSAIKLLPPDKLGAGSLARFEREVQLTAQLTHPNTIRVFDYGRTPDGTLYYVMEYLEGAGLDEVVALTGPMPAARVIHVLDQVAGALGEAHAVGLIHRDIKPANIYLTQQGGVPDVAKVLDFGLVKQVDHDTQLGSVSDVLTRDDSVTGTPQYMPPEAITAPESVDARSDLYALGAVGYFLLTGQHVFSGRSVVEVCSHHLHSQPRPPSERLGAGVPPDLERLLLRCLEKDPKARPESARALQSELRTCEDASRWSESEARAWFERHGRALHERRSRAPLEAAATIAVDMDRRALDTTSEIRPRR